MKLRSLLIAASVAGLASAAVLAQQAPESLLPPGFDEPRAAPTPSPRPSARPSAAATSRAPVGAIVPPRTTAQPVVQALPGQAPEATAGPQLPAIANELDPKLIDELVEAARPKADIPAQQARNANISGLLAEGEGGFPANDTRVLNGSYVSRVVDGTKGPLVSRWGQILLRRALVSQLIVPAGMKGADWTAARARLLMRLGEVDAARALVQQVDSGSFTPALEDVALDAYIASSDILGACPLVSITASGRQEAPWQLARQICRSFEGEGTGALSELERLRRRGVGGGFQNVDLLLAQKYAGAALESRKAVKIEWGGVEELTPWRYGMANAVGIAPPKQLLQKSGHTFDAIAARAPMLPLDQRAAAADYAAARGILSSAAMVDLWSQIFASDDIEGDWKSQSDQLREAYVGADPAARLAAIKALWGDDSDPLKAYSRRVLTAYAAARLPVSADLADDADGLLTSMLAAGLDRNATRWQGVVEEGSLGWGLIATGVPGSGQFAAAPVGAFRDSDSSENHRKSRFLLAGLYGLGRLDQGVASNLAGELGVDLGRQTRWTRAIRSAADSRNGTLVVLLAGLGMQGDGWSRMTPLYLYHIVSALRRVGLEPEARMIAAEAVARG